MKQFKQFELGTKQQHNTTGKGTHPEWAGQRDDTGQPAWAGNGGRKHYHENCQEIEIIIEGDDIVVEIDC